MKVCGTSLGLSLSLFVVTFGSVQMGSVAKSVISRIRMPWRWRTALGKVIVMAWGCRAVVDCLIRRGRVSSITQMVFNIIRDVVIFTIIWISCFAFVSILVFCRVSWWWRAELRVLQIVG